MGADGGCGSYTTGTLPAGEHGVGSRGVVRIDALINSFPDANVQPAGAPDLNNSYTPNVELAGGFFACGSLSTPNGKTSGGLMALTEVLLILSLLWVGRQSFSWFSRTPS